LSARSVKGRVSPQGGDKVLDGISLKITGRSVRSPGSVRPLCSFDSARGEGPATNGQAFSDSPAIAYTWDMHAYDGRCMTYHWRAVVGKGSWDHVHCHHHIDQLMVGKAQPLKNGGLSAALMSNALLNILHRRQDLFYAVSCRLIASAGDYYLLLLQWQPLAEYSRCSKSQTGRHPTCRYVSTVDQHQHQYRGD